MNFIKSSTKDVLQNMLQLINKTTSFNNSPHTKTENFNLILRVSYCRK